MGHSVCKHTPGGKPFVAVRRRRNPHTSGAPQRVNFKIVRWTILKEDSGRKRPREELFRHKIKKRNNSSGVPVGNAAPAREGVPFEKTLSLFPRSIMERDKIAMRYNKENPSLAGIFLLLNSPPDCLTIHLFRSARCVFVGLCPTPRDPFEKGSIENFSVLDKT